MEEVIMPKMGLSMEVGKIEEWKKKEGDKVTAGEILFILSTEKISIEIEAYASGYLRKIIAKEGDEVPVTQVIAYIGELDEDIPGETTKSQEDAVKSVETSISAPKEKQKPETGRIRIKESIPIKGIRKVISEKMSFSAQNIPHIMQTIVINADNLVGFRENVNKKAESEYKVHITYTDLLIKAAAIVLAEQPIINSSWQQDNHVIYDDVNVAIGISTDAGLVVATVFNADKLSIFDIAKKRFDYVEKAKQNLLTLEEISDATFTISNLGMYGIRNFTALINPPQAGILMTGEIYKSAVEAEGKTDFKKFMDVSIAVDHRIIDGADSVRYLKRLKEVIENPEILLR